MWHAEFTFPAGLDNHERAVIHEHCRKFGFTSKSHGFVPLLVGTGSEVQQLVVVLKFFLLKCLYSSGIDMQE